MQANGLIWQHAIIVSCHYSLVTARISTGALTSQSSMMPWQRRNKHELIQSYALFNQPHTHTHIPTFIRHVCLLNHYTLGIVLQKAFSLMPQKPSATTLEWLKAFQRVIMIVRSFLYSKYFPLILCDLQNYYLFIIMIITHPAHSLFALLPSGKWYCFSACAKNLRLWFIINGLHVYNVKRKKKKKGSLLTNKLPGIVSYKWLSCSFFGHS